MQRRQESGAAISPPGEKFGLAPSNSVLRLAAKTSEPRTGLVENPSHVSRFSGQRSDKFKFGRDVHASIIICHRFDRHRLLPPAPVSLR